MCQLEMKLTIGTYLPGINLIENIHKDKSMEDHCEVEAIFECPFLTNLFDINVHKKVTSKQEDAKHRDLKNWLPEYVAPHAQVHDVFILALRFAN